MTTTSQLRRSLHCHRHCSGSRSGFDDSDSDDEKPAATAAAAAEEPSSGLPSFEDAINQAETLSGGTGFLFAPQASLRRKLCSPPEPPPEESKPAAASSSSSSAAKPPPKPPPAKAPAKAEEKKGKESLKDRTKLKRQRDQSASFLGGRWKSDLEMSMRDNFDS